MKSWDVIIAGAGIIGVSLALELRERGATVLVLDRGEPGSEASSAAAGMLSAADPETPVALRPLVIASERMFPAFVQKMEAAGAVQVGFRRTGTIALLRENAAPREYRYLSPAELQLLEPSIHSAGHSAFFVQEDSVDPLLLTRAALTAARNSGVEIQGHTAVTEMRTGDNGVEVVTETEFFLPPQLSIAVEHGLARPCARAKDRCFTSTRKPVSCNTYCVPPMFTLFPVVREKSSSAQPWKTLASINL